jgi:hypothetical protein
MSSCFSLAQIQSMSTICGEKYCSCGASRYMISIERLMSSTCGFSTKINSMIYSLMSHWVYFSRLSHFVQAYYCWSPLLLLFLFLFCALLLALW